MSAFVPPLFKNFGKSLNELFTKKYSFTNEVKVKTTAEGGITVESTGKADKGDLTGNAKVTLPTEYGTLEGELATDGKSKANFKNDKAVKGLTVKLSGSEKPSGALDVDYQKENFATSIGSDVSSKTTTLAASAVVGFDGLSLGAEVKYDVNGQALSDYTGAIEYKQSDFTATVKTAKLVGDANKKSEDISFGYLHQIDSKFALAGLFDYSLNSGNREFGAALSYKVDKDLLFKGKASNNGTLTALIEQRLASPALKYAFSTEFDKKFSVNKFGVALSFGDE